MPVDWLPDLPESGEGLGLIGLAFREPEDNRYLGGVIYLDPGVAGALLLGSRPRRDRCEGVRGMSDKSSFGRYRGYRATTIFTRRRRRMARRTRSGYVGIFRMEPSHTELVSR